MRPVELKTLREGIEMKSIKSSVFVKLQIPPRFIIAKGILFARFCVFKKLEFL